MDTIFEIKQRIDKLSKLKEEGSFNLNDYKSLLEQDKNELSIFISKCKLGQDNVKSGKAYDLIERIVMLYK